ncbi:MAG TPA: hypothetical protein VN444_04855, partial [Verrucomicrobiae bacterium]|nr:hypothetical protein [Verrucomicrobiae bacterium]
LGVFPPKLAARAVESRLLISGSHFPVPGAAGLRVLPVEMLIHLWAWVREVGRHGIPMTSYTI